MVVSLSNSVVVVDVIDVVVVVDVINVVIVVDVVDVFDFVVVDGGGVIEVVVVVDVTIIDVVDVDDIVDVVGVVCVVNFVDVVDVVVIVAVVFEGHVSLSMLNLAYSSDSILQISSVSKSFTFPQDCVPEAHPIMASKLLSPRLK